MVNIICNNLISKECIEENLQTKAIGKNIYIFDNINSTNSKALTEARNGAENGSVFIAEYQSSGSGRTGKSWFSEKNKDILMSILLYPKLNHKDISKLTLITGLCVCKVLINELSLNAKLKWPNDIVVGRKKICGILTKSLILDQQLKAVVIGIGLNVNSKNFPSVLNHKATSILLETGFLADRSKLIAHILNQFENNYFQFLTKPLIPHEYMDLCVSINKQVSFLKNGVSISGKAVFVDNMGNLAVETKSGIVTVNSNEVVVQGIY